MRIKLMDLLNEGRVSDILFHKTSINGIHGMLNSDKIFFTPSIGTQSDNDLQKNQKFYYLSTSRIKTGGYAIGAHAGWVNLVLNGRALGATMSSVNVDYWGSSRLKPDTLKTPNDKHMFLYSNENEERILSTKPFIKNVKKYIKEIHILVEPDKPSFEKWTIDVERMAKKRGIPIFFYVDSNSAQTHNKRKAFTSLKDIYKTLDMNQPEPEVSFRVSSYDPMKRVKLVLGLLNKKSTDELTSDEKKFLSDLRYYKQDSVRSLEADIHNSKTNRDDDVVKTLYTLTRIMKKFRLHTIAQVIDTVEKIHGT